MRVVIEGLNVTSGVQRNSMLGPLIFLIYVYDLPSAMTCNSDLFADNTVFHHQIAHTGDCEQLQQDLLIASKWCNRWLITLRLGGLMVSVLYSGASDWGFQPWPGSLCCVLGQGTDEIILLNTFPHIQWAKLFTPQHVIRLTEF